MEVIFSLIIIFIVELFMLSLIVEDFSIFNPIRNYRQWSSLNWFGVGVITLLLNIIFIPYAVGYWIYKLFTIGRR
jgi:uncharacterized membrane protein